MNLISKEELRDFAILLRRESEGIDPISFIKYHTQSLRNIFIHHTEIYFGSLSNSVRFFDLLSVIVLGALVLLTLVAFSKRHHIPFSSMASYFYYLLDHKATNEKYIHGVVYGDKDQPISGANVYIIDSENEEIIDRAKTNKRGEFFHKKGDKKYLIMVMAKGYKTIPFLHYEEKKHIKFKVTLEEQNEGVNLLENVGHIANSTIGVTFEGLLILTFIFEILFINSFGILKTLPFLGVSVFNLLLWILYLRRRHHFSQ